MRWSGDKGHGRNIKQHFPKTKQTQSGIAGKKDIKWQSDIRNKWLGLFTGSQGTSHLMCSFQIEKWIDSIAGDTQEILHLYEPPQRIFWYLVRPFDWGM